MHTHLGGALEKRGNDSPSRRLSTMSLDSDHINYLVYRYLQESGFQHTSFTFGQESGIVRMKVAQIAVPPGSLILALQRALNYSQAEVNLTESGQPAELDDLETIDALTLIESVQPDVCDARRAELRARLQSKGMPLGIEVPKRSVKTLVGHTSDVCVCAWNPKFNLIASGSSDSTARIWSLDDKSDDYPKVLQHVAPDGQSATTDVTTLEWKKDGMLLATGFADGTGRIWSKDGNLKWTLSGHQGPVFALKWNEKGDKLVTTSVDHTAIVWNASTGQHIQQFKFHIRPCLDVDWCSNDTFATCSQDMAIYVCRIGSDRPLKRFGTPAEGPRDADSIEAAKGGHTDEVNAIRWDSEGKFLASCSDDRTAKIWSLEMEQPLHTVSHDNKVYTLKWGPAPKNSGDKLMLASASFDHFTKIWDALEGTCLFSLSGHTNAVYTVDFSPNGQYLATGSFDKRVLMWSTKTGKLVKTYQGTSGIYEVCWDHDGKRIAGAVASTDKAESNQNAKNKSPGAVVVIDFEA